MTDTWTLAEIDRHLEKLQTTTRQQLANLSARINHAKDECNKHIHVPLLDFQWTPKQV